MTNEVGAQMESPVPPGRNSLNSRPSSSLVTPPKTFGRLASRRFVSSIFGSPSMSRGLQDEAVEARKKERREQLRRAVKLTNGDVFGLTLRFMSEMDFTTHSTALALHTKCFTGASFIEWAMEQEFRDEKFRDEADAGFFANELLIRGIIVQVSRGNESKKLKSVATLSGLAFVPLKSSSKTFRGGDVMYSVKIRGRGELIAACFGTSTEEEKDGIRECAGRMKTLKSLIDGDAAAAGTSTSDDDDETTTAEAIKQQAKLTWVTLKRMPRRFLWTAVTSIMDTIEDFFSTLGPHILIAILSLLFMVWIQNFAFACVLSLVFVSHLFWVNERQREILVARVQADQLRKFQLIRGDPQVNANGAESADWWSAVFHHMWQGWLGGWVSRVTRETLEWTFDFLDLPFISKIELSEFRFGDAGPNIKTARTFSGSDGEMIVEWDLDWQTEGFSLLISAMFGKPGVQVPIPIRVRVEDVRIAGHLRLTFTWMRTQGGPYVRSCRISFVGLPVYSFSLKTLGAVNLSEIGTIERSLRKVLDEYFRTSLCEPNGYFWDVKEWWNSFEDTEEVIDPKELVTQQLMKDIERIWKRQKDDTTVEIGAMPRFVELDSSGKNSSVKLKYLDGNVSRMFVAMEYGRRRIVSKSHYMSTHTEAEYNSVTWPTWDTSAFAKLDTSDDVVDDQLNIYLMSERVSNSAKKAATKLLRIHRKIVGVGKISNLSKYAGGDIHEVEVTLLDAKTFYPVGIMRMRLRVNIRDPDVTIRAESTSYETRLKRMYVTLGKLPQEVESVTKSVSGSFKVAGSRLFSCFVCRRRRNDVRQPADVAPFDAASPRRQLSIEASVAAESPKVLRIESIPRSDADDAFYRDIGIPEDDDDDDE